MVNKVLFIDDESKGLPSESMREHLRKVFGLDSVLSDVDNPVQTPWIWLQRTKIA